MPGSTVVTRIRPTSSPIPAEASNGARVLASLSKNTKTSRRRRFAEQGLRLHEWTERPNALRRTSLRANLETMRRELGRFGRARRALDHRAR